MQIAIFLPRTDFGWVTMKFRKAQARLERRLDIYADTIKRVGPERARGYTRPGSTKKAAPRGRK